MKRLILLMMLAMPLLAGCDSLDDVLFAGGNCRLKTPDGATAVFKPATFESGSNYVTFFARSNEKGPTLFEMELIFSGDLKSGDIVVEQLTLCDLMSSSTVDTSSKFTGKVGFVAATESQIVLRLKNVRYQLRRGEYVLNGDLVVNVK